MIKRITIGSIISFVFLVYGCMELAGSKDGKGSRKKIEEYLTKEVYDIFIESGFKIHVGNQPAWITGYHDFAPVLTKSNVENDVLGRRYGDFSSEFGEYNQDDASISVYNYRDNGWYEYVDAYMTGSGKFFSLFYTLTYQYEEEEYVVQIALSGEIDEEYNIVDYQLIRLMKDNPGIQALITTGSYRMYEEEPKSSGGLNEGINRLVYPENHDLDSK